MKNARKHQSNFSDDFSFVKSKSKSKKKPFFSCIGLPGEEINMPKYSTFSGCWFINNFSGWGGKEKIRKEKVRRKSQTNYLISENYVTSENKQKQAAKIARLSKSRKLYIKDISENEDWSQAETFLTEVYFSAGKKSIHFCSFDLERKELWDFFFRKPFLYWAFWILKQHLLCLIWL